MLPMDTTKRVILFTLLAITSFSAHAQIRGSISFDAATQERHRQGLSTILKVASDCLEADYNHHLAFYRQWGISPFYGSNSAFSKLNRAGRMEHLRRLGKPTHLVDQMAMTSCVGLATKCMDRGFRAAGQSDIWATIRRFAALNNYDGTKIQHALQQLGWKVLYWNPDPTQNAAWDRREANKSMKGRHATWYSEIQRRGTYYGIRVDDARSLVGFGTNVPRSFRSLPFFFGTAHAGYHVFPGMRGVVIEGHSTRAITDYYTVESTDFNPLAPAGAPAGGYYSGLIAVPPGYGF
jgi:hypothetical protein